MDSVPMSNSLAVSKHLNPRLVSHCHVGATFRSVMLITKRCHAHKTVSSLIIRQCNSTVSQFFVISTKCTAFQKFKPVT